MSRWYSFRITLHFIVTTVRTVGILPCVGLLRPRTFNCLENAFVSNSERSCLHAFSLSDGLDDDDGLLQAYSKRGVRCS